MHYLWSFNTKFQRTIGVIYRSPSQNNAEFEEFLSNFEDISNTTASTSSIILWHVNARSSFWWKNDKTTVEGARLVDHTSLHFTENHIFFFQTSWEDGFSKKIGLKYDLSCIIGEDDISFSRKYDLAPWKWKMIFLKKIHGNIIFPSNVLKRWSFQKGPRWDMIFIVLSQKMVFFPENMIFFPWTGSWGWLFSGNTWRYDIFRVHVHVLQTWRHGPLSKNIKDGLIQQKYT